MVRGGSVGLNHSELMSILTTGQVPFPVLWFVQVQGDLVGLNHPNFIANYPIIVISSEAKRFEEVR